MNAALPIEQQFSAVLASHGLTPADVVADGKLHRFAGQDDKRGKESAWYVLHGDGLPAGSFGDWRTGLSETWCAKAEKAMTSQEREAQRQRIDTQRQQVRAERERLATEAQQLCEGLWKQGKPVSASHPYVLAKGIKPHGAKQLKDALLIALRNTNGDVSNLQFIQPDGQKRFKTGGVVTGRFSMIGAPGADLSMPLLICEGWATGCSLHEATGYPVAAAMNAGNLLSVAKAMRAQYPHRQIAICADDDHLTENNPGLAKAIEAGRTVNAVVVKPVFAGPRADQATDFNDLHQAAGLEAVRSYFYLCFTDSDSVKVKNNAKIEIDGNPAIDSVIGKAVIPALDERPCWRVYTEWMEIEGRKTKPGVYWHGVKTTKGSENPVMVDKWICSPMIVSAITRNREDAEYGRLLEILSPAGKWKKWAMPMSMLAGDGNEARAVLLSEGLVFDLADKAAILRYIVGQHPKETMRAASVTGWHDDAFVLPGSVIGADDIWFQATGRNAPYAEAGTNEGWQELAALAKGNPLLMMSISAALAGPLLGPLNVDGGGLHLYGDSSCGKTTALLAAISVWGGPSFKRTWRATANGLEGAGTMHSDTLLALDELGEIEPKALYESAYALINGMGKTRANRQGEARQASRWRTLLLSTGELTIAARMAAGGIEAKAGQELRILDIPVSGKFGLFDDLLGRDSGGVLSDEVRNQASKHYGHAGPQFVRKLVEALNNGLHLVEPLQQIIEQFDAAEGQERRAARTFALAALAGEFAAVWGIVPWDEGDSIAAAAHAFSLWRDRRAARGHSSEHGNILQAISDFIDKHGDARFSDVASMSLEPIVRDRAGYWKRDGDGQLFLFTSGGMKDASKGYELSRVISALEVAGALRDVDTLSNRKSKATRTPDGRIARLYHVDPRKLIDQDLEPD